MQARANFRGLRRFASLAALEIPGIVILTEASLHGALIH